MLIERGKGILYIYEIYGNTYFLFDHFFRENNEMLIVMIERDKRILSYIYLKYIESTYFLFDHFFRES